MKSYSPLAFLLPVVSGFINFNGPEQAPGLMQIIDAQSVQRLSINLDIGGEQDESHLVIRDVVFDLFKDAPVSEHVKMPGINGPHPKLSSGVRRLDIIEGGHYISLKGMETIKTSKSCWELNWKKDSLAGALVCGMEILEDYERNEATLAKGRIYLSFPVWHQEGLDSARSEKERVTKNAEEALQLKNEEMSKYQETNNPIMKALHYRNAYAAAETYFLQPIKQMEMVPAEDEVLELQDDLFLTTKGLIWSKALPAGHQVLLGSATITTKSDDE
eukprot:scaffold880_cov132-Cylindrotheca_fusiformis.AAC.55